MRVAPAKTMRRSPSRGIESTSILASVSSDAGRLRFFLSVTAQRPASKGMSAPVANSISNRVVAVWRRRAVRATGRDAPGGLQQPPGHLSVCRQVLVDRSKAKWAVTESSESPLQCGAIQVTEFSESLCSELKKLCILINYTMGDFPVQCFWVNFLSMYSPESNTEDLLHWLVDRAIGKQICEDE